MKQEFPILEFDPSARAVIEPGASIKWIEDIPPCAVICFFQEVIEKIVRERKARVLAEQKSEIGIHPVYEVIHEDRRFTLFHPGVGAPLAAGMLEEVIALGCRKFIACGGAGVLDRNIALGHVLVPVAAVRDEGVSYHYLPPGREVEPSAQALAAIERVLTNRKVPYLKAKTWTTDAIYRETEGKVRHRKDEGCLMVEMEAASLFAVARFRKVQLAQILYGGDDVSGQEWDRRHWDKNLSIRENIFWLAAAACLELEREQ